MNQDHWVDDVPGGEVKVEPSPEAEAKMASGLEIPSAYQDGLNLLEHCLHDKNTIYTSKILTIMLTYKIKADDPIFLLLLSVSELELILVNTPMAMMAFGEEMIEELENLFQEYFGADTNVNKRLELATAEYNASVASSAQQIIDSISERRFYGNVSAIAKTVVPAFALLGLSFGLGVFGTLHVNKLSTKALIGEGKLTVEQAQLLEWAESKSGKQAKLISELNGNYIGKKCEADAQSLNVKFSFGNRELESGYCVLLIDKP